VHLLAIKLVIMEFWERWVAPWPQAWWIISAARAKIVTTRKMKMTSRMVRNMAAPSMGAACVPTMRMEGIGITTIIMARMARITEAIREVIAGIAIIAEAGVAVAMMEADTEMTRGVEEMKGTTTGEGGSTATMSMKEGIDLLLFRLLICMSRGSGCFEVACHCRCYICCYYTYDEMNSCNK
jgi:hypothetical protein